MSQTNTTNTNTYSRFMRLIFSKKTKTWKPQKFPTSSIKISEFSEFTFSAQQLKSKIWKPRKSPLPQTRQFYLTLQVVENFLSFPSFRFLYKGENRKRKFAASPNKTDSLNYASIRFQYNPKTLEIPASSNKAVSLNFTFALGIFPIFGVFDFCIRAKIENLETLEIHIFLKQN